MQISVTHHGNGSGGSRRQGLGGVCIALAALACSRTEEAPDALGGTVERASESVSASSSSDERGEDGAAAPVPEASGSCSGPECSECPAPVIEISTGEPVWSRDPDTGQCCRYADLLAAPEHWPSFDTDAACQSDCRCSSLGDVVEAVAGDRTERSYGTERTTLDCRCAGERCPSTLPEAEELLCEAGGAQRFEGCGLVFVVNSGGLFGNGWAFEQPLESSDAGEATPRLVGAFQFSDVSELPCRTYGWVAGREFDCDSAVVCQLCGESSGDPVAPCE